MATIVQWESGTVAGAGGTVDGATVQQWTQGVWRWAVLPGGTSAAERIRWAVSAAAQYTLRFYVVIPRSWPGTFTDIMRASASGVQGSIVALPGAATPGQIRFRDSASIKGQSDFGLLQPGQIVRIEVQADTGAGTIRSAVFPLASDVPLFDTGTLAANVLPAPTQFAFGHFVNTEPLAAMAVGSVRVDDTVGAWIGRAAADDGAASPVEVVGVV